MTESLAIILPILLVDVLNPVLLGLLVFAAGTNRALANSTALLAGHTIAYIIVGIAISFGIEKISFYVENWFKNPSSTDFLVGAMLGFACLYWAFKSKNEKSGKQNLPEWELTPLKCFGFGAAVNFIGVPFALPYFAAVDQILKIGLSTGESLTVLVIYNIGYALPFSLVPVSILLTGDRSKPLLEKLNHALVSFTEKTIPYFLGLLGFWLLIDAAYFFITGTPLV